MKIAMIAACPFPWPRGTPIRIHRLAEALGRRGNEVHIVTYHLGDATPTPHMHIHRISGPAAYSRTRPGPTLTKLALLDPLLVMKLRRVLATHEIDVIHAHHYEGLICALLARGGRKPPVIFDAHTLLESELPSYSGIGTSLMTFIGRILDRRLPPCADHVIAVSDDIRDQLERLGQVRPSRVTVIGNGVEAEHFLNDDPSDNPPIVAFAGNLAPYQRVDLLLRAFALVYQTRPQARLRLLTDGDFTSLRPLARRLGIEDKIEVRNVAYAMLPAQFRAAVVLANPRLVCSGIPQKLLNYMASATAIVSFAGSAKILQHERSGLVVADGDIPAFATAILRLIDDKALASRLGRTARQVVTDHHSWDQVAERIEEIYGRLRHAHATPSNFSG